MKLADEDALKNYICPEGRLIYLLPDGKWLALHTALRFWPRSRNDILNDEEIHINIIKEYATLSIRERSRLPMIGPKTKAILDRIVTYLEQGKIFYARE